MAPSLPQTLAALGDAVWSADTLGGAPGATLASGYPALDAVLPGAGWPLDALSEVLQPPGLHGEWRLLLPVLLRLQQTGSGALVLVGPPHVPFGPALQAQGPTPTAPGLAPGWRPQGALFSVDPLQAWEAAA